MEHGSKREVWSVTELVNYLANRIDRDEKLQSLWIEGEISNFTHHASGHMYFTLKDETSKIKAVMFSRYNRLLLFKPKNGDRVIVRGQLYVYDRDGIVQLKVWEMRNSGLGDLFTAYLALKEKLEAEGLFSQPKKEIPRFPCKIGVITSAHGAAVRDIITTIGRRFPQAEILLFPVSVQGETAAGEIAYAIDEMNVRQEADVLIVGRGGGSIEELWAFNEEVVVRSIARSKIPVISAVGHETDTTLSDFAADLRAATPTAAAELAVPDFRELLHKIDSLLQRMESAVLSMLQRKQETLKRLWDRPVLQKPGAQLDQYVQRLDHLLMDLHSQMFAILEKKQVEMERMEHRLLQFHPKAELEKQREHLARLVQSMMTFVCHENKVKEKIWEQLIHRLEALNPLNVLRRGYAVVYRHDRSKTVTSVSEVKTGDLIAVRMKDGSLKCQVWGAEEENE
jgi:exodeoxyribonuclease VII large subunit